MIKNQTRGLQGKNTANQYSSDIIDAKNPTVLAISFKKYN